MNNWPFVTFEPFQLTVKSNEVLFFGFLCYFFVRSKLTKESREIAIAFYQRGGVKRRAESRHLRWLLLNGATEPQSLSSPQTLLLGYTAHSMSHSAT